MSAPVQRPANYFPPVKPAPGAPTEPPKHYEDMRDTWRLWGPASPVTR